MPDRLKKKSVVRLIPLHVAALVVGFAVGILLGASIWWGVVGGALAYGAVWMASVFYLRTKNRSDIIEPRRR